MSYILNSSTHNRYNLNIAISIGIQRRGTDKLDTTYTINNNILHFIYKLYKSFRKEREYIFGTKCFTTTFLLPSFINLFLCLEGVMSLGLLIFHDTRWSVEDGETAWQTLCIYRCVADTRIMTHPLPNSP